MTWWRYEERHGQGMLKTDREMEDAERGLHSTEVDSAQLTLSKRQQMTDPEILKIFNGKFLKYGDYNVFRITIRSPFK